MIKLDKKSTSPWVGGADKNEKGLDAGGTAEPGVMDELLDGPAGALMQVWPKLKSAFSTHLYGTLFLLFNGPGYKGH